MRFISTLLNTLLLLPLCGAVYAQDGVVTGTVSDASGPLPGANILEKGTRNGVQTDFEGRFIITVSSPDASLVISYLGYDTQEVAIDGQGPLQIILQGNLTYLDEAVVIGYGTTRAKDATGALVGIKERDFNQGLITSPEQLILGKATGVQLTVTSGEPGAGIQTRIRGSNSIRSDNNPLFVVDGIPLDGRATSTTGSNRPPRNPLNFLNPSDIASISVLKDASATAIYGSRGANGVVIITTKSGKGGGNGDFQFSSSTSIASPAAKYDLLDRTGFLAGLSQVGGNVEEGDFGGDTDWQDIVTQTSVSQELNLSWSRNYGRGNFFASVGFSDQEGVLRKTSLERIAGRFNWSHGFFEEKLELSFRGTITEIRDRFNERIFFQQPNDLRFVSGGALSAAYSANPTIPASLEVTDPFLTPSGVLKNQQITGSTDRYLFNVSLEYELASQLRAKITSGYDDSEATKISLNNGIPQDTLAAGDGTLFDIHRVSKLLEATLTYQKDFMNTSLEVLLGYGYQSFRTSGRNVSARGFRSSDLRQMESDLHSTLRAASNSLTGSYQQFFYGTNTNSLKVNRLFDTEGGREVVAGEDVPLTFPLNLQALVADYYDNRDELQSFFGRINFGIADKYLFTFTLRADGSSRFGPENRYGLFPSGAVAWKISDEEFIGPAVSTLKLRLSAGMTGNQEGLGYGNFVARQRFSALNINGNNSVNQSGLAIVATDVPDLKWETTTDFNIGLDWGFSLDRFSGSIDFYRKETQDLLLESAPAAPSTNPFIFGNVDAKVVNQGIELAMAYDFIQTADTNFSTSFNIAYNHNEIQDFAGTIQTGRVWGSGLSGSYVQRFEAGQSLTSFYLADFTGFDSNGFPTYRDIDGNGIAYPDVDRFFVGEDALPDITSGLSFYFNHKDWIATASLYGQFGFSVYNNTANALFYTGRLLTGNKLTQNVLGDGENPGATAAVSTRFLERGDFVRLQNASIGYRIPLANTSGLKSLLLSVTGQNLFIITGYSGLDPEVNTDGANFLNGIPSAGMDYMAYPRPRVFTFGVTARF